MSLNKTIFYYLNENRDRLEKIKKTREAEITYKHIKDKIHPIHALEKLVYLWPPHDIRINLDNTLGDYKFGINLLEDLVRGAEFTTAKRDLVNNILEIDVKFIRNLDEIERYNAAVREHNDKWVSSGSPTEKIDPITGDVCKIKDTLVQPVYIESGVYQLPEYFYRNLSNGELSAVRPDVKKYLFIKIIYHIAVNPDNSFSLGYVVYDYNNEIVYYNKVTHNNLSYLVRRSVQEIWGYPYETGRYIEGIAYLITGRKVSFCKQKNTFPDEISDKRKAVFKDDEMYYKMERRTNRCIKTATALTWTCLIGSIIICPILSILALVNIGYDIFPLTMSVDGFLGVIGALITRPPVFLNALAIYGVIYSRKLALRLSREASVLSCLKNII